MNNELDKKYSLLKDYLLSLKSAIVAFSAGVDSTFLLKCAHDTLKDNITAITIKSSFVPKRELMEAVDFCKENNIKHIIIEIDENEIEGFNLNPKNRCYICKKEIFKRIISEAEKNNIKNILEASNADDTKDYRPGLKAVCELNILSPLIKFNFTKNEIRLLSKKLNLKTALKPSKACLATRLNYYETITKEKLNLIETSEDFLSDLGFNQIRVRLQGEKIFSARIEIEEKEFEKIIQEDIRKKIIEKFSSLGFKYISLDLKGYTMGSTNKTI